MAISTFQSALCCVYFEAANDSHALWMKGEEKGQNVYSGSALHYVVVLVQGISVQVGRN